MKLNPDGSVSVEDEVEETVPAGESGSVDDALDFEDLASLDVDLVDDLTPEPPAADAEVTDEVTPPTDGGDPEPEPTPSVEGEQDPAPAPTPTETPEQFAQRLSEDRKKAIDEIAGGWENSLSPEDREALITEPARVIPRLLAQAQIQAFESAVSTVVGQLPILIDRFLSNQKAATDAESQFYATFGEDLRPHEQDIQQAIAVVRQAQPQLKRQEVAAKAVAMVRSLKGLTGAPAQPPATPRKPQPVRPASPHGARSQAAPPKPNDNPFAALADIDDY